MQNNFCHLHVHTEFSVLDGLGKLPDIVSTAKNYGFKALAITDHASVSGCYQFHKLCKSNNIQPIIGCEMYFVDDCNTRPMTKAEIKIKLLQFDKAKQDEEEERLNTLNAKLKQRDHITLLVKNEQGYRNLLSLVSESYLRGGVQGGYGRMLGRADWGVLDRCKEGLICMTACAGGVLARPLIENDADTAINRAKRLQEMFGDDLYVEIMPIDMDEQVVVNKLLIQLAQSMAIPLVATNDCHYVNKEDSSTHDVLLAIQQGKTMSSKDRWEFSCKDLYLKTRNEMEQSFTLRHNYISTDIVRRSLDISGEIAEKINFDFPESTQRLPNLDISELPDYGIFQKWRETTGVLNIRGKIEQCLDVS